MADHLTREQISRLLDEPDSMPDAVEHITGCTACANEYERMSRMRMALSALAELEPPASEWAGIEERIVGGRGRVARVWIARFSRPLQAAAVVLLFAAGLAVGSRLGAGGEGVRDATGSAVTGAVTGGQWAADEAYVRSVAELQALRSRVSPSPGEGAEGPTEVAERITHLDALIEASREALRSAPADPVLNNFLFEVVDERERLAGRLDETLRLTTAEY